MKKITSAVCGLALTLAVAGVSFAAQAPATGNSSAPAPVKKHVKKHSSKKAATSTATPAAPATK